MAESTDLADGTVSVTQAEPESPSGVLDAACLSYGSDEKTVYSGPSDERTVYSGPSSSDAASQDPKRRRLD